MKAVRIEMDEREKIQDFFIDTYHYFYLKNLQKRIQIYTEIHNLTSSTIRNTLGIALQPYRPGFFHVCCNAKSSWTFICIIEASNARGAF